MNFIDPVRQCKSCSDVSQHEVSFFQDKLKILSSGASFEGLLPNANTPTQRGARQLYAYFSDCNRFLVVEQKDVTGLGRKMEIRIKLDLINCANFACICQMKGAHKVQMMNGVKLNYKTMDSDEAGELSMSPSRLYGSEMTEAAMDWLNAFYQATKFVSEKNPGFLSISVTNDSS